MVKLKLKFKSLIISILFTFLFSFLTAKPPELTPEITRKKAEEILSAHMTWNQLDEALTRRILVNFIDEIDPLKIYLIKQEIIRYIEPSDQLLKDVVKDYKRKNFKLFNEIYQIMLLAIERREQIENKIEKMDLPQKIEASDFQDLDFAENNEALEDRLLKLRALQLQTADKIGWKSKENFLQLLRKRRLFRERTLKQSNQDDQQKQMLAYFLKAFASSLDNHTFYFTPSEVKQFMIQLEQRLSGIGAELCDDVDGLSVVRLLEGGPAFNDGRLHIDDRIVAVGDEPIAGMDIHESVEKIRGPKGTTVTLTVLREAKEEKESQKIELTLVRDEIALSETRFGSETIPYGDGVIAILRLFSFYQNGADSSAADIKREIERLKEKSHLLGIILDLRGNAGGILSQAVEVAGLFMKKGIIVSVKDNKGSIRHLRNFNGFPMWEGPLVVLTNKGTASCAEIVAQALQDYHRAIIVGDATTWGKGSYQSFTLEMEEDQAKINPEGEFKVTRGLYYTTSGKSPQLTGMAVDIDIPGPLSNLDIGEAAAKFPLKGDIIAPNFKDDLADLSPLYRWKIKKLYKEHRQQPMSCYQVHIPRLKSNSTLRLKENPNYQRFLKAISKESEDSEERESYGQNDLQLEETCNVMKDMIWLMRGQPRYGDKALLKAG